MTKRLKYTKDILTHMLNNNNNKPSASGTGGPNRMGTITSAVSSKRSGMGGNDMLGSQINRAGSTQNNFMSSDRKPLNVLNQIS